METNTILNKAAEKAGLIRTKYTEKNVPTNISSVCILPIYADIKYTTILSSLLLKRYREELKSSKYFILCSWPGMEGLFPYVNEYWSLKDENSFNSIYSECNNFNNNSDKFVNIVRNLNYFFEDVIDSDLFSNYYNNGIKDEFFNTFKHIKRFLPTIPSSGIMGSDFNRKLELYSDKKVFIYPTTYINIWSYGKTNKVKISKVFWIELVKHIINKKITPVICKNMFTYDLSDEFTEDCIYVQTNDLLKIMAIMRQVGCTLDVFNDVSKLSIISRSSFVMCQERKKFISAKEYEIDDLFAKNLQKDYIFTFPTSIFANDVNLWKINLFDNIDVKLNNFISNLDIEHFPSPSEIVDVVQYSEVRENKIRKINAHYIKNKFKKGFK